MKVFGERLKELRLKRNMTQDELGLIFENPKAQSTIGTWERGTRQCSFEDLVRLSNYFNVTTDYLLDISREKIINLTDLTDEDIAVVTTVANALRSKKLK